MFVGQVFGVHKAYLFAIGLLWAFSGLLASATGLGSVGNPGAVLFATPALDQLALCFVALLVLAVLLRVSYANSRDSVRTLVWAGLNPVAWAFFWLSAGGLVDNYTKFPFIVVGLVILVLQVVLVGAFLRSSLRQG